MTGLSPEENVYTVAKQTRIVSTRASIDVNGMNSLFHGSNRLRPELFNPQMRITRLSLLCQNLTKTNQRRQHRRFRKGPSRLNADRARYCGVFGGDFLHERRFRGIVYDERIGVRSKQVKHVFSILLRTLYCSGLPDQFRVYKIHKLDFNRIYATR